MNLDKTLEVGHETQEGVTEIQHEEAVIKAGALQDAIFNSANFSSIATDAKGVIQIFNVGAERMLGYLAEEVMNTITPAEISDPQELITRAKALSAEFDTPITPGFEALVFKASRGIEDIYELTYIRKDGSRFPAVVSVTALRDIDMIIIGYLLIGTDNTARKQVEAEQMKLDQRLRDQQFYTRSLIESNIDALMTTDPAGITTAFRYSKRKYQSNSAGRMAPFKVDQRNSWSLCGRVWQSVFVARACFFVRGAVRMSSHDGSASSAARHSHDLSEVWCA